MYSDKNVIQLQGTDNGSATPSKPVHGQARPQDTHHAPQNQERDHSSHTIGYAVGYSHLTPTKAAPKADARPATPPRPFTPLGGNKPAPATPAPALAFTQRATPAQPLPAGLPDTAVEDLVSPLPGVEAGDALSDISSRKEKLANWKPPKSAKACPQKPAVPVATPGRPQTPGLFSLQRQARPEAAVPSPVLPQAQPQPQPQESGSQRLALCSTVLFEGEMLDQQDQEMLAKMLEEVEIATLGAGRAEEPSRRPDAVADAVFERARAADTLVAAADTQEWRESKADPPLEEPTQELEPYYSEEDQDQGQVPPREQGAGDGEKVEAGSVRSLPALEKAGSGHTPRPTEADEQEEPARLPKKAGASKHTIVCDEQTTDSAPARAPISEEAKKEREARRQKVAREFFKDTAGIGGDHSSSDGDSEDGSDGEDDREDEEEEEEGEEEEGAEGGKDDDSSAHGDADSQDSEAAVDRSSLAALTSSMQADSDEETMRMAKDVQRRHALAVKNVQNRGGGPSDDEQEDERAREGDRLRERVRMENDVDRRAKEQLDEMMERRRAGAAKPSEEGEDSGEDVEGRQAGGGGKKRREPQNDHSARKDAKRARLTGLKASSEEKGLEKDGTAEKKGKGKGREDGGHVAPRQGGSNAKQDRALTYMTTERPSGDFACWYQSLVETVAYPDFESPFFTYANEIAKVPPKGSTVQSELEKLGNSETYRRAQNWMMSHFKFTTRVSTALSGTPAGAMFEAASRGNAAIPMGRPPRGCVARTIAGRDKGSIVHNLDGTARIDFSAIERSAAPGVQVGEDRPFKGSYLVDEDSVFAVQVLYLAYNFKAYARSLLEREVAAAKTQDGRRSLEPGRDTSAIMNRFSKHEGVMSTLWRDFNSIRELTLDLCKE